MAVVGIVSVRPAEGGNRMAHLSGKWTRLVLALAVVSCCVGCDQATKQLATQTLRGAPAQSYFSDTLRLEYALNAGGFLSLGSDLSPGFRYWLFVSLNVSLLAVIAYVLATKWKMHLAKFVALICLFAGGVGNLTDRLFHNGLVTDFINVGVGPIRTGIFNIADVAITFGGLALLFMYRSARSTSIKAHE